MHDLQVFHFEENRTSFEDFGKTNGITYWYASDLLRMLGYESLTSFQKAINRAVTACTAAGIPIAENFIQDQREISGKMEMDYKLSRFACYLTAMNADPNKPQVAAAQTYFIALAESFRQYVQQADNVDRVLIRDEITDREKSLSGVARKSGVSDYALFQNAGYRGMYNMDLYKLRMRKGVDSDRSLLDFMGREELAGNLFRITQTEAKVRNHRIVGQRNLEIVAEQVGGKVRKTMRELSGTRPEDLPIAEDIKQVKSSLKRIHREFVKLDEKRKH
jgi:DNA-damage-inducible protein D